MTEQELQLKILLNLPGLQQKMNDPEDDDLTAYVSAFLYDMPTRDMNDLEVWGLKLGLMFELGKIAQREGWTFKGFFE